MSSRLVMIIPAAGYKRPGNRQQEAPPMKLKKVLTYAAIAFVVFYLYNQPHAAAGAVRGVFDTVNTGASRLATFFTSVLPRS
ncbi:hypothetical protein Mame01_24070 [Microbispora amethystogenes]|nr:hypothetical protein Mame01_24070 [Microbispora amethystogenes]